MYAIRSYYEMRMLGALNLQQMVCLLPKTPDLDPEEIRVAYLPGHFKQESPPRTSDVEVVITSYSIHYTKLYERDAKSMENRYFTSDLSSLS